MNRYLNQIFQLYAKNKNKNKKNNINIWDFIAGNDASLLEFFDIYDSFKKNKFKETSNYDLLTKIGNLTCKKCEGRGLVFDKFFQDILMKFKKIIKNRPPAIPQYDQAFIKAEDVIRRVEFIYERGDLLNSKILVIGDDDLISIALGLTYLPEIIYVIEIDQRLIEFIKEISQKFNLNIKTFTYNVCDPLPKDLINKFDVFISDPVETEKGLKIFLLRGMLSLKINSSGYFGLTTLESGLKKWYKIEKFILDNGFVITDIKRNFSIYPIVDENTSWGAFEEKLPAYKIIKQKATVDWYTSNFIRIEKIKNIKISNPKIIFSKDFYTDKEALATPQI